MSSTALKDKKIIYITPEELASLSSDEPVYVLSTQCSSHDQTATTDSTPCTASTHVSERHLPSSNVICSTRQAYAHTSGVAEVSVHSTNKSNFHSVSSSAFAIPSFVNSYPQPYFANSTQFPWVPQLPVATANNPLLSPFNFSVVYPPRYPIFPMCPPPFNPNIPPPLLKSSIHSTDVGTSKTVKSIAKRVPNRNQSHSHSDKKRCLTDNESDNHVYKQKSLEPLRYSKLIYAPSPEYFVYDQTTGCYNATQKLVDLEDQFEDQVIGRRFRVTANDPPRQPPDRPVPSNNDEQHRLSRLHQSRRPTTKKSRSKWAHHESTMLFNNIDSSENDPALNCDRVTKRMRLDSNISGNSDTALKLNIKRYSVGRQSKIKPSHLNDPIEQESNEHFVDNSDNDTDRIFTDFIANSTTKEDKVGMEVDDSQQTVSGHSIGQRTIRQQSEVAYKLSHPNRLHPDIWHNEFNEFNDGPACSCKPKYQIGSLHNQYEGEKAIPHCNLESNNADRLYHYRVLISPLTNFLQPKPTKIRHNHKDYTFDGFSIFTHYKLDSPPPCQILRFNLLYDMLPIEEDFPQFFTVRALDILTKYIFNELLELLDLNWKPAGSVDSCSVVHLLPRFIYLPPVGSPLGVNTEEDCPEQIGELLSINVILSHWLHQALTPVIDLMQLASLQKLPLNEWSKYIADLRGSLATYPGKKPAAIRIDQLDRQSVAGKPDESILIYPLIVHMTYTPMKLSLTREPKYKCVLKNFMKLQYLMMNKPRINPTDRTHLILLANELEEMEHSGVHRREITVELSSEGFYRTGIRSDVSQYALNLVSLVAHLRFHKSLETLESRLEYKFKDKSLLHQALTHPSYRRTNFGTNQDHFQNSLVSCGPRILEYGDKLQLYKAWRKKGLTKMIQVMSCLPKMHEERSNIYGNERLEFLGDAVIEVISSIHLFFMLPDLSEGHLDAYRQAIVQNQHLAELAVRLGIHKFLLYTHSVDFCYDSTFIYARSDAFEALMAAIALDANLDVVDRIFGAVLFGDDKRIHRVWIQIPRHPLQIQCPSGDREWATKVPMLKKLCVLEDSLGIKFKHIRLLARAMTIRKTGFNFYTLGDNQRLEFLGDSLLKYVSTDYLFRHFPRHHEGHLSLLKNSLVNKYTQASVCSELGLEYYVMRREENSIRSDAAKPITGQSKLTQQSSKHHANAGVASSTHQQQQNVKYRADLLEAFIGALFVDKDLTWIERFCQVCFWPRLVEFILKQEWNDAKSKLQQCCLTFRSLHEDPEIAHYKVLEQTGPTNQRVYRVGVYFRGQRLATGQGRSVQQAQMEAAKNALELHQDTFRQLDFQRSVIAKRYKQPYIDKMLDQVDKWDEQLVNYFVADTDPTLESQKLSSATIPAQVVKVELTQTHEDDPDLPTVPSDDHHDIATESTHNVAEPNNQKDTNYSGSLFTNRPSTSNSSVVANQPIDPDEEEEGEIVGDDDDDEYDDDGTESDEHTNTKECNNGSASRNVIPSMSGTLADLLHLRKPRN